MRKITGGFLFFGYLFLALTIGAMIWRAGLGAGAGAAGVLGALGILAGAHAIVTGMADRRALRLEIGKVREAHRLLADAMESTQGALTELAQAIETGALSRTDALTGEVRMLEGLVQQMSASIEERLAASTLTADTFEGRRQVQSNTLLKTVHDALSENRVDLYLQPVVTLPQRRTVYYESFTRLRDPSNRVMMPAEYLSVAEGEGLLPAIDNLLLFRCAQIVRRLAAQDRKVGVFCNISLASLGDETFFPQFLDFLNQNRDLKDALIFELGQATFDARGAIEARNMAKLADLGFRFSIDKVQTLDLDFADLQRSDVRFIKVAADLLIEQLLDLDGAAPLPSQPDIRAGDFAPLTRRHGLELIAEKVESEKQVVDILELDVAMGQGHLFGEPRAIKEAVLAETDPPADFVLSTLKSAEQRVRL
ncbi:flagella assembly cyclic-di-GMP phosphodiesterase TipF [Brevundimonas guildfordensis]|jgi:cyclic-di-GMP phosphodiesterase TipF (flagellum assembly factor)|uniref:EAL domain-containing protein n=1 Tax=Brevundimonas guildfordensis TaxID=2762241 RepID=A0ABR8QZU3_9CAUL|nr:EAL domain-containing protein [Brevundimonas guildfordensis]MBD7941049.1 EAL domain-containing protein [Brevundimonas guildfordensis]